jgi:hypothetical protein
MKTADTSVVGVNFFRDVVSREAREVTAFPPDRSSILSLTSAT